jgi:hypothetical protein
LGGGLLAQNKPAEAIELLAPGESSARQGFTGGNAARLGQFLSVLGRSRAAAGEFDAAEDNLVEACAILSEAPGAKSEDLAITRTGLIELYYARHAAEPDKGFDAKAAELRAVQLSTPAATQSVHQ